MSPLDDDKLRSALRDAHSADARGAPDFDEMWAAAEGEQRASTDERDRLVSVTFVAAAAAVLLVGLVGVNWLVGDDSATAPVAQPELAAAPEPDAVEFDEETFADYDILEWQPPTDGLLARDERALEPPLFGDPSWGDDGWLELESEHIEEL